MFGGRVDGIYKELNAFLLWIDVAVLVTDIALLMRIELKGWQRVRRKKIITSTTTTSPTYRKLDESFRRHPVLLSKAVRVLLEHKAVALTHHGTTALEGLEGNHHHRLESFVAVRGEQCCEVLIGDLPQCDACAMNAKARVWLQFEREIWSAASETSLVDGRNLLLEVLEALLHVVELRLKGGRSTGRLDAFDESVTLLLQHLKL